MTVVRAVLLLAAHRDLGAVHVQHDPLLRIDFQECRLSASTSGSCPLLVERFPRRAPEPIFKGLWRHSVDALTLAGSASLVPAGRRERHFAGDRFRCRPVLSPSGRQGYRPSARNRVDPSASAASTSLLLVSLSKTPRLGSTSSPEHLRAEAFPIKASDNPAGKRQIPGNRTSPALAERLEPYG